MVFFLIRTGKEWAGREMKNSNKSLGVVMFVSSLICLIIPLKLFWNLGVYTDDYGGNIKFRVIEIAKKE
jgi:hypothetical protein